MYSPFYFSKLTIITRWEHSAIINCEDDQEFIRLVKNQRKVLNLMFPAQIIKLVSREGEKATILYQPGYHHK